MDSKEKLFLIIFILNLSYVERGGDFCMCFRHMSSLYDMFAKINKRHKNSLPYTIDGSSGRLYR